MKDVNNEENYDVQEDIQALWRQINQLEKAVASLIYNDIYYALRGRLFIGKPIGIKNITSERTKELREDLQELIDEVGGEREFIEIFLGLSDYHPNTS